MNHSIDAFNNSMNDVLSLLSLYLDKMELTIHNDGSKFIKMIAINIFSIHHVVNNIQGIVRQLDKHIA